jgi:hypothetical protein
MTNHSINDTEYKIILDYKFLSILDSIPEFNNTVLTLDLFNNIYENVVTDNSFDSKIRTKKVALLNALSEYFSDFKQLTNSDKIEVFEEYYSSINKMIKQNNLDYCNIFVWYIYNTIEENETLIDKLEGNLNVDEELIEWIKSAEIQSAISESANDSQYEKEEYMSNKENTNDTVTETVTTDTPVNYEDLSPRTVAINLANIIAEDRNNAIGIELANIIANISKRKIFHANDYLIALHDYIQLNDLLAGILQIINPDNSFSSPNPTAIYDLPNGEKMFLHPMKSLARPNLLAMTQEIARAKSRIENLKSTAEKVEKYESKIRDYNINIRELEKQLAQANSKLKSYEAGKQDVTTTRFKTFDKPENNKFYVTWKVISDNNTFTYYLSAPNPTFIKNKKNGEKKIKLSSYRRTMLISEAIAFPNKHEAETTIERIKKYSDKLHENARIGKSFMNGASIIQSAYIQL